MILVVLLFLSFNF